MVLCRATGSNGGHHPGLLDDLAVRFRLLVLGAGLTGEPSFGDGRQSVDRADEEVVAVAMAAGDALMLWFDPDAAQVQHALPPEPGSALAMQVPVIPNDLGELGALGRSGHLLLVPLGDVQVLAGCLDGLSR